MTSAVGGDKLDANLSVEPSGVQMVQDAAALTDLLAEHEWRKYGFTDRPSWKPCCTCGVTFSGRYDESYREYRAHVAEVLAGYVTTARAQAWDEGAAWQDASPVLFDHHDNPYSYRTTENTA